MPIDPFYLTWKAREHGISTRFIELAGEINTAMPHYVVDRAAREFDQRSGRGLRGARILLVGIAYMKNVADMRQSPAFKLIELLEQRGATVEFFDPELSRIPVTREHPGLAGRVGIGWNLESIGRFDVVVIATDHDAVDYHGLAQAAQLVIDTLNPSGRVGIVSENSGKGVGRLAFRRR